MIEMMLAAALMQSANDPADWACADPLIEKNYKQEVSPFMLAKRIHDECVKPFASTETNEERYKAQRSLYAAMDEAFLAEIKRHIDARRLRDEIPLTR